MIIIKNNKQQSSKNPVNDRRSPVKLLLDASFLDSFTDCTPRNQI